MKVGLEVAVLRTAASPARLCRCTVKVLRQAMSKPLRLFANGTAQKISGATKPASAGLAARTMMVGCVIYTIVGGSKVTIAHVVSSLSTPIRTYGCVTALAMSWTQLLIWCYFL